MNVNTSCARHRHVVALVNAGSRSSLAASCSSLLGPHCCDHHCTTRSFAHHCTSRSCAQHCTSPVVVLNTARPAVVLNTARPVVFLNTARPVVVSPSRCDHHVVAVGPSVALRWSNLPLQASGARCVWWSI